METNNYVKSLSQFGIEGKVDSWKDAIKKYYPSYSFKLSVACDIASMESMEVAAISFATDYRYIQSFHMKPVPEARGRR